MSEKEGKRPEPVEEFVAERSATGAMIATGVLLGGLGGLAAGGAQAKEAFWPKGSEEKPAEQSPKQDKQT